MSAGALIAGLRAAPTVVLVHGLASSYRVWDRVVPRIESRADVLAVHLASEHTIGADADDVAALLTAPAVLVGHSRGALVATALAERHPHLVARLVLVCPPWSRESRLSARSPVERALAVPGLGDLLWGMASDARQRAAQQTAFAPHVSVPDQFVADARARGRRNVVRGSRAIDTYLGSRRLADRLRHLRVPADLVFGRLDARVAAPANEFATVPGTRVRELPGVGHTPPWERPETIVDLIVSAVDTIRAR
ncbi:alpha/beta fold hydrolase [Nocardia asteroides]|uniref:alpha/beta fold hydrolase n=1 Tax=Nocardia asteroides TaxID=1824 RepID=UPI003798C78A